MRAIREARDPWALAVAAAAGIAAYLLTVPWPYALLAVAAVVVVRVAAEKVFPTAHPAPPAPVPVPEPSAPVTAPGVDRAATYGDELTPTELKVAALVFESLQDKEIAARLGVQPSTVHKHMEHIFDKLGVHSRLAVAKWYGEHRVRNTNT